MPGYVYRHDNNPILCRKISLMSMKGFKPIGKTGEIWEKRLNGGAWVLDLTWPVLTILNSIIESDDYFNNLKEEYVHGYDAGMLAVLRGVRSPNDQLGGV